LTEDDQQQPANRCVAVADLQEIFYLIPTFVWETYRNKRLFLTGGTGFIGKWLLEALIYANCNLQLNLQITVLTRNPDAFTANFPHLATPPFVDLLQGDITSFVPPQYGFDLVIHAALPIAQSAINDAFLAELSRVGCENLLAFAERAGVRRVLHISSGAVYGPQPSTPQAVAEDAIWQDAHAPNSYMLAKRAAEEVFLKNWPIEVVTARLFTFIGPFLDSRNGTAAAEFLAAGAGKKPIILRSNGKALRTYQYASDMVRWLLVLLVIGQARKAYNVGGDDSVSVAEFAREVAQLAGLSAPLMQGSLNSQNAIASLASDRYIPSLIRAQELGLVNVVTRPEAIRRTLGWHRLSHLKY